MAGVGIELRPLHRAEVEHQAAVADGAARHVVATAPHGEQLSLLIAFRLAAFVIGLLLTVPLIVLGIGWLIMAWRVDRRPKARTRRPSPPGRRPAAIQIGTGR
jgi:hypothetical protein